MFIANIGQGIKALHMFNVLCHAGIRNSSSEISTLIAITGRTKRKLYPRVMSKQGKSEGFDSCGGVAEKTQINHHRWTLLLIATTINKVLQSL